MCEPQRQANDSLVKSAVYYSSSLSTQYTVLRTRTGDKRELSLTPWFAILREKENPDISLARPTHDCEWGTQLI
jgi:hypothetical protein